MMLPSLDSEALSFWAFWPFRENNFGAGNQQYFTNSAQCFEFVTQEALEQDAIVNRGFRPTGENY